jgi:hypothetical protein
MKKLKIGFDPSASKYLDYKENIRHLSIVFPDTIELFIVTESSEGIEEYKDLIGIEDDHIFIEASNSAVIDRVLNEDIMIYMSGNVNIINDIITDHALSLSALKNGNVDGSVGIHVNDTIMDTYKSQKKYFTALYFWIKHISVIMGI